MIHNPLQLKPLIIVHTPPWQSRLLICFLRSLLVFADVSGSHWSVFFLLSFLWSVFGVTCCVKTARRPSQDAVMSERRGKLSCFYLVSAWRRCRVVYSCVQGVCSRLWWLLLTLFVTLVSALCLISTFSGFVIEKLSEKINFFTQDYYGYNKF